MPGIGLCKPAGGLSARRNVQFQPRVACAAGRGGGGRGGRGGGGAAAPRRRGQQPQQQQREQDEDVEIFSLEKGWNVDAIGDVQALLGSLEGLSDSEDEGSGAEDWDGEWSVEAGGAGADARAGAASLPAAEGSDGEGGDEDWGPDEDDEVLLPAVKLDPDAAAAAAAVKSAGRSPRRPGAAGAGLGMAERDLLSSLPTHLLRRLEGEQAEADAEAARLQPAVLRKAALRQKTHRRLRIVSGHAAGRRLLSPMGDETRPMMEMVRGALFNMIMSLYGCPGGMPEGSRWLDLFAGTGAIGLEALSRGCAEAHFVELSPWVTSNCLLPNIEACEAEDAAVVHTGKAEDFMRRAAAAAGGPRGGAFDFVSVCPPYELVDYTELYDLLEGSPLVGPESLVIVEYPRRLAHLIQDRIGGLAKLRDRRYGRTFVAMYGPEGAEGEE